MASRLDRLVTLLDAGSTHFIRHTAAEQLGRIQAEHPEELFNLLIRVLPYLQSKSWDTRTAAAKAIGGIVENTEKFDPNAGPTLEHDRSNGAVKSESPVDSDGATAASEAPSVPDDQLQLETLEVVTILKYGQKLLGSGGREYDVSLAAMDPASRLAYQKKRLTARLGLGGEYMEDDLVTEKDFTATLPSMPKLDTSVGRMSRNNSLTFSPLASAGSPTMMSAGTNADDCGLSKRQLNQLKRKNKLHAKNPASKIRIVDLSARRDSTCPDMVASPVAPEPYAVKAEVKAEDDGPATLDALEPNGAVPADDSPLVAEYRGPAGPDTSALQAEPEADGVEWPFERLCAFLMVDLFDQDWEIRHGAAMGLREVIRVHGAGAGRERGKDRATNDALNRRWLGDLACRLCCVFVLDRFGDYVSDTVVAPIRETAGQTLGALLAHLAAPSVRLVYRVLYRLVMQDDLGLRGRIWEVCHGGMIGLRYLVAVRDDLLLRDDDLIDGVREAATRGLLDPDDDVRAVGAATLIPIAGDLVSLRPRALGELMNVIWDCLSDLKDDLSASTGSVMDLLAKLCSFPAVLGAMKANASADANHSFARLVPRLYPFLRHTITTVRSAVLRALLTFLELGGDDPTAWVDGKILRLAFQNLLVERNEDVLKLSYRVWTALVTLLARQDGDGDRLAAEFGPHLDALTTLSVHPIGVARHPLPADGSLFLRPSGQTYALSSLTPHRSSPGAGGEPAPKRRRKAEKKEEEPASSPHNIDGAMMRGDVDLAGADVLIRSRIYAARAMGRAMSLWPPDRAVDDFAARIVPSLSSVYSTSQIAGAMIVEEYARDAEPGSRLAQTLAASLQPMIEDERPPTYRDLVPLLQIVRAQCQSLLNAFRDSGGISPSRIPSIAVVVQGDADAGPGAFSVANAEKVVDDDFVRLKKALAPAHRITSLDALNDARKNAVTVIEDGKGAKEQRDVRVRAAAASALVALGDVPKKPSQIIKGMMDSVKAEENAELQRRSASAVASLVQHYTVTGRRGPVDKITSNLVKFCCVDTSETPEFHRNRALEASILSLRKEEDRKDHPDAAKFAREARHARIMRRGSKEALEQLARLFGADLLDEVPMLRGLMEDALRRVFSDDPAPEHSSPDDELGQQVVDGLSTVRTMVASFHPALRPFVLGLLPPLLRALHSQLAVFRYAAAKCLATICSVVPLEGMTFLVEKVLPAVSNPVDVVCRQGGVECIYHLLHVMEDEILPYVVFLIVPVLGRMSDSDNDVRLLATTAFATLVKLVPLEAGIPDPPGFSEALLKERESERTFIAQMLDVHKVEPFQIPVAIKAELRSYQQEGVNWLAFLNRYHLHGILCDDMGLGKTLQTLCIVASDHHMRAKAYAETQAPDVRRLPSLIVCPPTLSGHWQQEIKTYAPFLSSLSYVGPPSDRHKLKARLGKTDIVITSYDICRNDVETLALLSWNYCVLDEGHLIKNPKTKVTMAVKRLRSEHRLILSGTPIQNNVLELWSLFDFLMPGFLGTEKVFWDRFAKPIAASRNSKSSSKEQESGALAIEALHKQVLPFLLRRLKEEVLNDLPPKIIQNYYCELSELQKRLFDDFHKKESTTLAEKASSGDKEAKQHIFQALQYMRKLCNSPALVVKPGHKQFADVQKHLARQSSSLRDTTHAPKLTALRDLLVDCGIGVEKAADDVVTGSTYVSPHRALIFCQMKEMLDMVQLDVLKKLLPSVQYLRLDGGVEANKRQEIVNRFNSDPSYDVLLLTTSVGGLGLNLTGADTVIFVEHDWNPQKDMQAMDRAHRIGQKKVVNVYRLITRGTLEEKILSLQRFKIDVASTVVNQQNAGLGTMETDQILDLFSLGETAVTGEARDKGPADEVDEDNAVDATGAVKEKGKKGWLDDLGELWDDRQYQEEYDLDSFLATMKG